MQSLRPQKGMQAPDESPHEGSLIEWWFVHGYYEGRRSPRKYFMCTILRQKDLLQTAASSGGCTLLHSVLDTAQLEYKSTTRIDRGALDRYLQTLAYTRESDLLSHLVDAYFSELREYGPPRPIRLETSGASVLSGPLNISWDDFSLAQTTEGFALSFCEPDSKRRPAFQLRPAGERIFFERAWCGGKEAMAYSCYPRLSLHGVADGAEVSGEAWFDHQWGEYGWLVSQPQNGKVRGWDWFGINLDQGVDLLIMVHRDMKTRRIIDRNACIRRQGKEPIHCRDFTVKPLAHWESEATHIRYPVGWRILIPKQEVELTFTPFAPQQEVPFLGVIRTVWEGAGAVRGKMGGTAVQGRGWLELHGYGFVFDFEDYLAESGKRIDKRIEEFLPRQLRPSDLDRYLGPTIWSRDEASHTKTLSRPVWDLMARKGKHWRPILAVLLLEALGVNSAPYESLAFTILELSHTGALIIDDIEDDSLIRRGETCIHRRYGLGVAINAANTLYFLPYLLLSNHAHLDDDQRLQLYRIMIRSMVRSHFGQAQDIYWSSHMNVHNFARWMREGLSSKILEMYAYKTAASVEAAAEMAGVIAGTDRSTHDALVRFARAFGVAFQVQDDVHDFSNSSRWKKTHGEDLALGKPTYVVVRALERLEGRERVRLRQILCSKASRNQPSVLAEGVKLVRKSGALQACGAEASSMLAREWERLSEVLAPSEAKTTLRMLCTGLLDISYEA